jgi:hypothetical protein
MTQENQTKLVALIGKCDRATCELLIHALRKRLTQIANDEMEDLMASIGTLTEP